MSASAIVRSGRATIEARGGEACRLSGLVMGLWSRIRSALSTAPPPSPPRLPATSEAALAAALASLPAHRRGWITMAEARALFSPMDAEYAFGETDEVGNAKLAAFAAHPEHPASLDFMPLEGRLYFTRKPA